MLLVASDRKLKGIISSNKKLRKPWLCVWSVRVKLHFSAVLLVMLLPCVVFVLELEATRLQWLSRLKIYLQCRRPGFNPWLRKIPWRREWLPTPVFLPGEFHGQRSLVGYSLWGHKESDRTERITLSLSFHLDTLCPEEEGPSFFPNVSSLGMRTPFPEIPIMSLSCFIVYVGLNSHSWITYW